MPIYSPTGFLDVTNATLRGSKIVTTSNVGIANLDPLNTLSVGSNLQVEDTGSNVLVIHGNAAMAAVTLGAVHVAPVYDLEVVTNLGNTVSNTVQFTNDTTGFVSVSNIEVGTNNLFVDTTTGEVTVGNKLNVTDAHASNLTVASALYANAETGRVGVHTTNPGNFALDVHGSANVGALTANSLVVTGNLAVAGEITSIRSTTVTVDDPIIGLANNNTTGVLDVGFVMQRPDANVAIIFDESSDTLEIGYTQGKHTDTTITMDDSSLFHTNIHGNVSVSNLEIGQFSVVAAYGLDHVTNENNSTGDTIISTNGTTGLQTTANVDVGRDLTVARDLTVDTSTFHVDSSTNRVGVLTTSPGYDLDVHGSANVGTLTTGNLEVGTANLFVDTTTGNVGIGVTDPGHNLDIVSEMNLRAVSNTASIKYNSNVVTEYVRSKKLIKYPRVYMTAATTSGYTASASTSYSGGVSAAWRAFDGVNDADADSIHSWDSGAGTYTSATPGVGQSSSFDGKTGEYINLKLPDKIRVISYQHWTRMDRDHEGPHQGFLYGSNDGFSTYKLLHSFDNIVLPTTSMGVTYVHQVNTVDYYDEYRLLVTETQASTYLNIAELAFYGIPEYDPEAHGTDVIARSVPNVPNTDWLEVYYDAKNYSGTGDVQDETANNRDGVLYGNTTLSSADGIHKFDFDGNGDYIKTTLTGFTGTTVTFSVWVFMDSVDTTRANTIMGLGSWGGNGSAAWIAVGTGGNLETGNKGIGSCGSPVQANTLTGQWLHITGIVSSGDFRLYQDGQLIKSLNITGTINYGTNPVLYLATRANSSGNPESTRYFDCKIANARLFNRALTSDEIYQLYAYQKEYFGHGVLGMTLKAGRLGIGTLEPKAVLDVRGDAFSKMYNGGRSTFMTWDYLGSRSTSFAAPSSTSGGTVESILDHEFDVPACYHDLGTATLKAYVKIDWRGECQIPWNFLFRIKVYYNDYSSTYTLDSSAPDQAADNRGRGCGVPCISYHADNFDSTPEAASVTSLFTLPNCQVSSGSKIKVELLGVNTDVTNAVTVYTGRCKNASSTLAMEMLISSFFVALDVV